MLHHLEDSLSCYRLSYTLNSLISKKKPLPLVEHHV